MTPELDPAAVAYALAVLRAAGDDEAAAELLHLLGESEAGDEPTAESRVRENFTGTDSHGHHWVNGKQVKANPDESSGAGGAKGGGVDSPGMSNFPTRDVSPEWIRPVNATHVSPLSQQHVTALAADMEENGWRGRPLLVIRSAKDENDYQAMTGSHRLDAAQKAGIDVPTVKIDEDEFLDAARRAGYDLSDMEESTSLEDEDRLKIADELGGHAAELMRAELDHYGDSSPK